MKDFDSLESVAQALEEGDFSDLDTDIETVEELVDALVATGDIDQVFVSHDDHLGLKDGLPSEFLNLPLSEATKPEFEDELEEILDQANIIIPLANRELSEDDIDDIREDKIYRGEDPDD